MTTKKVPGRTYVSLSFSCPPQMERAINRRAAELGLHSRSDYLRKLFEQDLENAGLYNKFSATKKAPPRITRGRRKKKPIEQGEQHETPSI